MSSDKVQSLNNIFDAFPKYDLELNNANNSKTLPFIPDLYDNSKDTVNISSNNIKKKTIASSILTTGILGIMLAKGFHGSSIQKLSNALSKETIYYAKKGTDRTLNALQATSNFTAIKDLLFDKLCSSNSILTKFAQGARNLSKKVVDNTLSKKYDKVGLKINNITSLIQEYNIKNIDEILKRENPSITIKGVTKKLSDWRDDLLKHSTELHDFYNEGFSLGARKARSDHRDSLLSGTRDIIYDKLFKQGGWKKADTYKTYITEVETRDAQNTLKDMVVKARKNLTNNIDIIHENLKSELLELTHSIKPKDEATSTILEQISRNLEKFKFCSGKNEAEARKIIANKMTADLDKTISKVSGSNLYSEVEKQELIAKAEKIKLQVQNADENSKGALENIMTILKGLNSKEAELDGKKIISDAQFNQFDNLSKQVSSKLIEATDKEVGEYFLKQAEMELGSAATDVFSILFPVGAGAYAVGKCNNNDERISATLKTCIPLIGMFGTFVYGTTKMLSGAKNLIFSTVSGFVLNKFGSYLDDLYQNYKKSGSVMTVAKGEYNHVWSDLSVGLNGKTKNAK